MNDGALLGWGRVVQAGLEALGELLQGAERLLQGGLLRLVLTGRLDLRLPLLQALACQRDARRELLLFQKAVLVGVDQERQGALVFGLLPLQPGQRFGLLRWLGQATSIFRGQPLRFTQEVAHILPYRLLQLWRRDRWVDARAPFRFAIEHARAAVVAIDNVGARTTTLRRRVRSAAHLTDGQSLE